MGRNKMRERRIPDMLGAQIVSPMPKVTAGPCGKEAGAGGGGGLVNLKLRLCGALLPCNTSFVGEFELAVLSCAEPARLCQAIGRNLRKTRSRAP